VSQTSDVHTVADSARLFVRWLLLLGPACLDALDVSGSVPTANGPMMPPSPLISIEYRCAKRAYTPTASRLSAPAQDIAPTRASWMACSSRVDPLDRARGYLARVSPAIAGAHGDVHTFRVCRRLVRGFSLNDIEALAVLTDWNALCQPRWSEHELVDKLRTARRYGREPVGGLFGTALKIGL
jgi:hypothetical protein